MLTTARSRGNLSATVSKDVVSSFVVLLVALPLSLGIAIASGAPTVMAGIIAAAIGGIVASSLGGAPMQVSGPAAGLTLVVYSLVTHLGWGVTCAATVAAGVLQLFLGGLKVGNLCLAISPAVVHGMLGGIGVVITLSQIHIVLGGSPESSALRNLVELPAQLADLHGSATFIGIFTILLLIVWSFLPAKVRAVPGALVAIVAATATSTALGLELPRVELPGSLFESLSLPEIPQFSALWSFAIASITIALVASTESLLCAVATDKLHSGERANLNRELTGQGFANILSGLLGGLPITGVIVRSSANIRAGAQTRLSAILHGIWILAAIIFFRSYLELIPLAALAGLLVVVGIRLIDPKHIREVQSHREGFIYFVTLFAVTFWDLLGGVALGLTLSALNLMWRLSRSRIIVEALEGAWHVEMKGAMTFLSVPELITALATIPAGTDVNVDLRVDFIDHAALDALHNWRLNHENTGGKVDIDEKHDLTPKEHSWKRVDVEQIPLSETPKRAINQLVTGAAHFNQRTSRTSARYFAKLAREGQSPKTLFIGCSDSRVVTPLLTGTGPGDLFKLRNVGNLVPENEVSVGATIDFAVGVLEVELIVVCGHSDCGAMKALLANKPPTSDFLRRWLEKGRTVVDSFRQNGASIGLAARTNTQYDTLAQLNAVRQLENLRQYSIVREREAAGQLDLCAMYFDIAGAKTYIYDPAGAEFVSADILFERLKDQTLSELALSTNEEEVQEAS